MEPFVTLRGKMVALPIASIDTDQIFPGRFLRVTDKSGMENMLFADWRFGPDGAPKPDFVLNKPQSRGAAVLVAGDNFGAGSSREHAPWALLAYGFRAIVSTSFADIFRNNALKNGLLPIVVDAAIHRELLDAVEADPSAEVEIDLEGQVLRLPSGRAVPLPIDPFNRRCLLEGVDELGYLLSQGPAVAAYEAAHPSRVNTLAGRA